MELPLRFNVGLAIVVEEAPNVRELGQERARDILEWRLKVSQNVLGNDKDSPEADRLY